MKYQAAFIALILGVLLLGAGCQPLPESGKVPTLSLVLLPTRTVTATPSPSITATPWPTVRFTAMPTPSATPALEVTATPDSSSRAWAQQEGVLSPAPVPWEELVANGLSEGSIMLYADSGRALSSLESLGRAVEGLTVDGVVVDSLDIYLRLQDEIARGVHQADVVLISDPARAWSLLQQQRIWTFLPPDLAESLASAQIDGLLTHHWTALTWVYNPSLGEPNITSWWDLTDSSWTGRLVLADPRAAPRTYDLLSALDQESERLALEYATKYGRPLQVDKDCPNAACQWFKMLLANKPILLAGEAEVAQYISQSEDGLVRVGLAGLDTLARENGAPNIAPLVALEPFTGLMARTYIAIVDQAPHPQAAKLAVRWLLGDSPCDRGWATWCLAGFYSLNADIPDPEGLPSSRDLLPRLIDLDPRYADEHQVEINDWITLQLIGIPLAIQNAPAQ